MANVGNDLPSSLTKARSKSTDSLMSEINLLKDQSLVQNIDEEPEKRREMEEGRLDGGAKRKGSERERRDANTGDH